GGGSNGFNSSIYFVRSTDHGQTFSSPMKLSQTVHDIQFPDISVTGDGHVYVTYRQFADVRSNQPTDAIAYNASTDCGASFSAPRSQAVRPTARLCPRICRISTIKTWAVSLVSTSSGWTARPATKRRRC